jgi:predicted membrane-bound mannosyltransferase
MTDTTTPTQPDLLPDSGARSQYQTGAVRDASVGKGHFHSIPPVAMRKLAKRFEDGARKYSANNWMKGIPLSHYEDSLSRHVLAWKEGDTVEDHAGAIIWNACCMIWTDEEIKAGRLPSELDDLPYRQRAA